MTDVKSVWTERRWATVADGQGAARDLLQTFVGALVLFVLTIPTSRFLVHGLGLEGFGAYQMARRLVSAAVPLMVLGLNTALVRELSLARDRQEISALLVAGLGVVIIGLAASVAVAMVWANELGRLVFGTASSDGTVPLLWLLAATAGFTYVYAAERGRLRLCHANVLTVGVMGVGPFIVSLGASSLDVQQVILYTSWVAFALVLPGLVVTVVRQLPLQAGHPDTRIKGLLRAGRRLVDYGARKMAGPLLTGCMYLVGPAILTYRGLGIEAGSYFVGVTALRLCEQAIAPVAVVMLPRLSRQVGQRGMQSLGSYASAAAALCFGPALFVSLQAAAVAPILVRLWFGDAYGIAVKPFVILMLIAPLLVVFSLSQTIVDALTKRAVVLRHLLLAVSLNAVLTLAFVELGAVGIAIGVGASYAVLALLTLRFVIRNLGLSPDWKEVAVAAGISAVLCLSTIAVSALATQVDLAPGVPLAWTLVAALVYGFAGRRFGMRWYRVLLAWIAARGSRGAVLLPEQDG